MASYIVVGKKAGSFTNNAGELVEFYRVCLDIGSTIKVVKMMSSQKDLFDSLEVGEVLDSSDCTISQKTLKKPVLDETLVFVR